MSQPRRKENNLGARFPAYPRAIATRRLGSGPRRRGCPDLEERFGFVEKMLDRAYRTPMRRDGGFGVNPWRPRSRVLVSYDLLIDPIHADPVREWLGPLPPGSLLIL
jgi:hypothetical protein